MNILKGLQEKQQRLDDFIYKSNNVKEEDVFLDKIIALDVELSEFVNELEFFKYWRKNKGKENALEEACDCLHFILSLANTVKVELKYVKTPLDYDNLKEDYLTIKSLLITDFTSCVTSNGKAKKEAFIIINMIFNILIEMVRKVGFTYEDLIKEYDRKYEINIQRQKEGY